jgi:hypothetical protein
MNKNSEYYVFTSPIGGCVKRVLKIEYTYIMKLENK